MIGRLFGGGEVHRCLGCRPLALARRDPLKHLAGGRARCSAGAALRCSGCVTAPLAVAATQLPVPSPSRVGPSSLHIRSAPTPCTPAPLTKPWASVLPRCPNAVSLCLCPCRALPCLALPCAPTAAYPPVPTAPACCHRPRGASQRAPQQHHNTATQHPIAVAQRGPPAAQSRQNSSTPTDRPHGQLVREEREGGHQDQGTAGLLSAGGAAVAVAVSAHPIVHRDALTPSHSSRPQSQSMSSTSSSRPMRAKQASPRSFAPSRTACATRRGPLSSRV